MARIDGSDRLRLPSDSGIRTSAYSAREHAASGPAREAVGDWLQLLQRGSRDGGTEPLARAIEQMLTRSTARSGQPPASLPLTVIRALESRPTGNLYQVQLGNELLVLRSSARLEPGQTLTLVPNGQRAEVLLPQNSAERLLIMQVAQRQQWAQLASPEPRSGLQELMPWIRSATPAERAPVSPVPTLGATQPSAANAPQTPMAAQWVVRSLPQLLGQWLAQLPTPGTGTSSTPTSSPVPASSAGTGAPGGAAAQSATPQTGTGQPTSGNNARPTVAGSTPGDLANRLQTNQHWIMQLIQTARTQYGEATPQTIRQVWQGWQQAARHLVGSWQTPDFSQVQLTPAPGAQKGLSPLLPSAAATTTAAGGTPGEPIAPGANQTLADRLPLLQLSRPAGSAETGNQETSRPDPSRLPGDLWRLLAAQLIDQRFQQAGLRSAVPSLQEQLHRRAETLLQQTPQIYSPANIRRLLQPGGGAGAQTGSNAEQQSLLQVRQLLEQFSQQQVTRLLQTPVSDPGTEQRPLQQALPVLHGDQVVWFELHREPFQEGEEAQSTGGSSRHAIDLHFHLPPMAPVCARVAWRGSDGMEITFLTDDTPTLRLFHTHLDTLNRQLGRLALPVEQVHCRHGLPTRFSPGGPGPGSGHIDVHT